MFLRNLIFKSRSPVLAKSKYTFFQIHNYLTGAALAEFRKEWYSYSLMERMQIAVTENSPLCGDVLITKGDYFKQEMLIFQAEYCYNKAVEMNADCADVVNARIAELAKHQKKLESENDSGSNKPNNRLK
jgi:hypothetical protein